MAFVGKDEARVEKTLGQVKAAAVIDFVGNDATASTAVAVLRKGGRLVMVGIGGGELTLSAASTIFRAQAIQGSLTGTIQELREVIDLARQGRLSAKPVQERPKDEANAAMEDLEHGLVTGRIVLVEPAGASLQ
jgi:alcohol dehydrogenase/propanol-preferring alcohol dehydrogenase